MTDKRDYYEILNVNKNSTKDDIKNAYRKLALQYHPDRNKSPEAEDKFKEISEAYAVLSDDEKRRQYDTYGHAGINARYSSEDIFSANLRYDLEMGLEEVNSGLETRIYVPRKESCENCKGSGATPGTEPKTCSKCMGKGQVQHVSSTGFGQFVQITACNLCSGNGKIIDSPCKDCKGTGIVTKNREILVKIPAGVNEGSRLRLIGEGEAGIRGGSKGDLYVVIHIKPHEIFRRRNADILFERSIGFVQAALGTEIDVPTIEGRAKLKIPAGTQTDTIFKLRGKGLPKLNGFGRGDELIRVVIRTPKKLTTRQRELLEELAKEMGEDVKKSKRFFG